MMNNRKVVGFGILGIFLVLLFFVYPKHGAMIQFILRKENFGGWRFNSLPASNFTSISESKERDGITCVPFKVMETLSTPICVYNATDDTLSKQLLEGRDGTQTLQQKKNLDILMADPELQLLDFGANLGIWTLSAARLGRKVLASEMYPPTITRLQKSIRLGQLQGLVTLVPYPLSDAHEKVPIYHCHKRVKMAMNIFKNAKVMFHCGQETPYMTSTVTMNDLTNYLPNGFNKAFMKIDIEEMELRAFNKSEHFLKVVDVPIILMEWMHHIKRIGTPQCSYFLSYMTGMGYVPFEHLSRADGRLGILKKDKRWWKIKDLYLVKDAYIKSNLKHLQENYKENSTI